MNFIEMAKAVGVWLFILSTVARCPYLPLLVGVTAVSDLDDTSKWSEWSEWSPCSSDCGGGLRTRTRTCLVSYHTSHPAYCRGNSYRIGVCNLHACSDPKQDRLKRLCQPTNDQSAADSPTNDQSATGDRTNDQSATDYRTIDQSAAYSPTIDQTAAVCQSSCGDPSGLGGSRVSMASRLTDGMPCGNSTLAVCVDGRCQEVGCDHELESEPVLDACGVCGGDGFQCSPDHHQWSHKLIDQCHSDCLQGHRSLLHECVSTLTGRVLSENMCRLVQRPQDRLLPCSIASSCSNSSHFWWRVGEWSECGGGCSRAYRTRSVSCVVARDKIDAQTTSLSQQVDDELCRDVKPVTRELCASHSCVSWYQGAWSECSNNCGGDGGTIHVQTRGVFCRDTQGALSDLCDVQLKPVTSRPCPAIAGDCIATAAAAGQREVKGQTGVSEQLSTTESSDTQLDHWQISSLPPNTISDQLPYDLSLFGNIHSRRHVLPVRHSQTSFGNYMTNDKQRNNVNEEPFRQSSLHLSDVARKRKKSFYSSQPGKRNFSDTSEKFSGEERVSGAAGGGDVGITRGSNDLRHSVRFSPGQNALKPVLAESRFSGAFGWKRDGYKNCSAVCLGGVQEQVIKCVELAGGAEVSPFRCDLGLKPPAKMRACNDVPCQAQWSTTQFSHCSRSCGKGEQTRTVSCQQALARGAANILPVPPSECPQPPPPSTRTCSTVDCLPLWMPGPWSECSRSCGGGFRHRWLKCRQQMADGSVVDRAPSLCSDAPKPDDTKQCNSQKCLGPTVVVESGSFQQSSMRRRVTVGVGGEASVYAGTTVKILCPVQHFDSEKIVWIKNGQRISASRKYKMHRDGRLSIKMAARAMDSGNYTCIAGDSSGSLMLTVTANPYGEMPWVTEYKVREQRRKQLEERYNKRHELKAKHMSDFKTAQKKVKRPMEKLLLQTEDRKGKSMEKTRSLDLSLTQRDSVPASSAAASVVSTSLILSLVQAVQNLVLGTDRSRKRNRWRNRSSSTSIPTTPPGRQSTVTPTASMTESVTYDEVISVTTATTTTSSSTTTTTTTSSSSSTAAEAEAGAEVDHLVSSSDSTQPASVVTETDPVIVPTVRSDHGHEEHSHGLHPDLLNTVGGRPYNLSSTEDGVDTASKTSQRHQSWTAAEENSSSSSSISVPISQLATTLPTPVSNNSAPVTAAADANVTVQWLVSDWSPCSQRCHGANSSGLQVRGAQCIGISSGGGGGGGGGSGGGSGEVTRAVPSHQCGTAGLRRPLTLRACAAAGCAKWRARKWQPCSRSPCTAWNTAVQKRRLVCHLPGGATGGSTSRVSRRLCRHLPAPAVERTCYRAACRGQWHVGEWTACSTSSATSSAAAATAVSPSSCGTVGLRTRVLRCVWPGADKRSAGNTCSHLPRPAVLQSCLAPACSRADEKRCEDRAKYCSRPIYMSMCRLQKMRMECCKSCQQQRT